MAQERTKRDIFSLALGLLLGAASWAIVPLMSDSFEPFDNEIFFYTGQSIVSIAALLIGYFFRVRH